MFSLRIGKFIVVANVLLSLLCACVLPVTVEASHHSEEAYKAIIAESQRREQLLVSRYSDIAHRFNALNERHEQLKATHLQTAQKAHKLNKDYAALASFQEEQAYQLFLAEVLTGTTGGKLSYRMLPATLFSGLSRTDLSQITDKLAPCHPDPSFYTQLRQRFPAAPSASPEQLAGATSKLAPALQHWCSMVLDHLAHEQAEDREQNKAYALKARLLQQKAPNCGIYEKTVWHSNKLAEAAQQREKDRQHLLALPAILEQLDQETGSAFAHRLTTQREEQHNVAWRQGVQEKIGLLNQLLLLSPNDQTLKDSPHFTNPPVAPAWFMQTSGLEDNAKHFFFAQELEAIIRHLKQKMILPNQALHPEHAAFFTLIDATLTEQPEQLSAAETSAIAASFYDAFKPQLIQWVQREHLLYAMQTWDAAEHTFAPEAVMPLNPLRQVVNNFSLLVSRKQARTFIKDTDQLLQTQLRQLRAVRQTYQATATQTESQLSLAPDLASITPPVQQNDATNAPSAPPAPLLRQEQKKRKNKAKTAPIYNAAPSTTASSNSLKEVLARDEQFYQGLLYQGEQRPIDIAPGQLPQLLAPSFSPDSTATQDVDRKGIELTHMLTQEGAYVSACATFKRLIEKANILSESACITSPRLAMKGSLKNSNDVLTVIYTLLAANLLQCTEAFYKNDIADITTVLNQSHKPFSAKQTKQMNHTIKSVRDSLDFGKAWAGLFEPDILLDKASPVPSLLASNAEEREVVYSLYKKIAHQTHPWATPTRQLALSFSAWASKKAPTCLSDQELSAKFKNIAEKVTQWFSTEMDTFADCLTPSRPGTQVDRNAITSARLLKRTQTALLFAQLAGPEAGEDLRRACLEKLKDVSIKLAGYIEQSSLL